MKISIRINLETISATVVSIHRRVHETVMSASDPAKARGANMAVTTMRTLRITRAK
jgi:hypothetical protein